MHEPARGTNIVEGCTSHTQNKMTRLVALLSCYMYHICCQPHGLVPSCALVGGAQRNTLSDSYGALPLKLTRVRIMPVGVVSPDSNGSAQQTTPHTNY
jgi:hypothetical protein